MAKTPSHATAPLRLIVAAISTDLLDKAEVDDSVQEAAVLRPRVTEVHESRACTQDKHRHVTPLEQQWRRRAGEKGLEQKPRGRQKG